MNVPRLYAFLAAVALVPALPAGAATPVPAPSGTALPAASPSLAASPLASPSLAASAAPDTATSPEASAPASAMPSAGASGLPSASPAPSATPARGLILAPAGFSYVKKDESVGGILTTGRYLLVKSERDIHFVFAGPIGGISGATVAGDLPRYALAFAQGVGAKNPGFKLLVNGKKQLCSGRPGYYLDMRLPGSTPTEMLVVFGIGGDSLYAAIYSHTLPGASLPAGVSSITSLCPPT